MLRYVNIRHLGKMEAAYLEDYQLQFCDVIRVHPVFSRLANKVLLGAASCRVSCDRISFGSDQVV